MKRWTWLPIAAVLVGASGASAQNALIDYQGYAWETGDFPPSNAGDVLSFVGVVDAIDSRFGVNFATEQVTLYVTSLTSTSQVDMGGVVISIAYTSGNIQLWRDPSQEHNYGVNLPISTATTPFLKCS